MRNLFASFASMALFVGALGCFKNFVFVSDEADVDAEGFTSKFKKVSAEKSIGAYAESVRIFTSKTGNDKSYLVVICI